jgi:hypothetical protein
MTQVDELIQKIEDRLAILHGELLLELDMAKVVEANALHDLLNHLTWGKKVEIQFHNIDPLNAEKIAQAINEQIKIQSRTS